MEKKHKIEVLLNEKEFEELKVFRLEKGWTMAELLRRAIKEIKEKK